jgi:cobalt-zinc-cadmium efflux system outer membrane protein
VRFYHLLIVLTAILFISINAQNNLTIDEAIKLSLINNIEIHEQNANIQNSELNLSNSSQLPNPIFSYSREDLKDDSFKFGEWTASGSIPINFLWERWSNIESKNNILEAQKYFLDHKKLNLTFKVREIYSALHNYTLLTKSLNSTLLKLSDLAKTAKYRVQEGDISEYELQRILLELNQLKSIFSEIDLQKRNYQNNLKLLIGYGINEDLSIESPELKSDLNFTKEELINLAIQNRNDIKASSLLVESENLFLSHNKLKVIPNINLTAGYKKQTDDLSGTILQVDFEIPLFNRNQIGIQQAEIGLSLLENKKAFLIERIKAEISEAYNRYSANNELYKAQVGFEFQNIFSSAAYSYEQGEISLVEFIDGLNAYVNGIILFNQLEVNLFKSVFDLERQVATKIINFNENNN